ncbi:MAG: cytochrome P450 [Chloroflexota bacterium]
MTKPYRLSWSDMGEFRRDQIGKVLELTQQLGRVAHISALGIPIYFISEPEMIREILVRHANDLHKDRFTKHMFKRWLGESILTTEGTKWQRQRKLIQPIFHAVHIHDFAAVFADRAKEMCDRWRVGDTYELGREMMELTLRIICRTMFSEDIDGLIDKMDEYLKVISKEAQFQLNYPFTVPNWVPLPTYRRQDRAVDGIHKLLLAIIHKRQARIQNGEEVPSDLLTMLLTSKYEDGQMMSDKQVLDECMVVFFAGHETTAVGLTWTWATLLQHPDVLEKLTKEIDEVIGDQAVHYEDLAKMPYLSQVIKEALRLHPPVAAVARAVTNSFDINGYHFKPKDTIAIHINTLHQQEEFYPEPHRFDPDRFAPDQEQPDRYTYMPFGAGSRICVGNAFAMLEMQIVLATMIQSLRLSLAPGQEFVPQQLITLRPRDGVKVKVGAKR